MKINKIKPTDIHGSLIKQNTKPKNERKLTIMSTTIETPVLSNDGKNIPDEKTVKVSPDINYDDLKLPSEEIESPIDATTSNGLKSCKKLKVSLTRLDMNRVYGSKKNNILKNDEYIKVIPNFISAVYETCEVSGDEKSDRPANMTLEDWKNFLLAAKCNGILMTRYRTQALKLETQNPEKLVNGLLTMASSGTLQLDAIAELEKKIAEMRTIAEAKAKAEKS